LAPPASSSHPPPYHAFPSPDVELDEEEEEEAALELAGLWSDECTLELLAMNAHRSREFERGCWQEKGFFSLLGLDPSSALAIGVADHCRCVCVEVFVDSSFLESLVV